MTRTRRLTLVATILGSTIVFLDSTVVNVALPAIEDDLGAGLAGQQWVVEAYALTLVSLLLVGGSMGDQFGRRRMFSLGLAGFGATSIICGAAPTTEVLVAGRALQGIAGAMLVPGSLALIAAAFSGPDRGRAVGTWTAWSGIATVVGPAGGGALIDLLSWHWIFWINVPLVLVTLAMARAGIEESSDPDADRRLDFAGVGLSVVGLGGPVFALIEQPSHGWADPIVFVPMALGLASLAAFLGYESRARHPMLDLALFRIRDFTVTNLATLAIYAGLTASTFFLTLYLQQVVGYSALEAGLATTPISILLFLLSPRFGRLASAIGPRLPMSIGPAVAGAGMVLLSSIGSEPDYALDVLPGLLLFGLGLSATVAPLTATVLDAVSEGRVGIASGVSNAVARVAGLLAIAVIGAAVAAQFSSSLGSATDAIARSPALERSLERSRAAVLSDGRGLDRLAPADRARVRAAAISASGDAMELAMLIAAGLMFAGGATAAVGLRRRAGLRGAAGHR